MNNREENKEVSKAACFEAQDILALVDGIPLPTTIKKNLWKSFGRLVTGLVDIPVAYLEAKSESIKGETVALNLFRNRVAEKASVDFTNDNALMERAVNYYGSKLLKEQLNRESVLGKTAEELKLNPPTEDTNKEIDDDWLEMFSRIAESKSNEEVQLILSKILAKEISIPGSISAHTLQILSVLTSEIGNSFKRFCNLSIDNGKSCYVIHPNVMVFQKIGPLGDYGISLDELFDLDGAGLIRSAETLMINYSKSDTPQFEEVNYAGIIAKIDVSGKQLMLLRLTKSGRELRNLLELTENKIYTDKLKTIFDNSFRQKKM